MIKKMIPPVLAICMLIACNSKDKKNTIRTKDAPTTLIDSLKQIIEDDHIFAMKKVGRLNNTQKDVQRVSDSIGKLPAATPQAVRAYADKLKAVAKNLEYADFAMTKWMMEYSEDSFKNNPEQRLLYLQDEKMKVAKMKDAIVSSQQKADSLLKEKF